jgi:hypothetical protein
VKRIPPERRVLLEEREVTEIHETVFAKTFQPCSPSTEHYAHEGLVGLLGAAKPSTAARSKTDGRAKKKPKRCEKRSKCLDWRQ